MAVGLAEKNQLAMKIERKYYRKYALGAGGEELPADAYSDDSDGADSELSDTSGPSEASDDMMDAGTQQRCVYHAACCIRKQSYIPLLQSIRSYHQCGLHPCSRACSILSSLRWYLCCQSSELTTVQVRGVSITCWRSSCSYAKVSLRFPGTEETSQYTNATASCCKCAV